MSRRQNKWCLIGGLVLAAIVAVWLGVPPTTVLLVGLLLLCPAAMYFGMGGMNRGSKHDGMNARRDAPDVERKPEDRGNRGG